MSDKHHQECQFKLLLLTTLILVVTQQHPGSTLPKFTKKEKPALTSGHVLKAL